VLRPLERAGIHFERAILKLCRGVLNAGGRIIGRKRKIE